MQNEANLAHQALWHRHPADDSWAGCPCHRFGEVANCAKRTQCASAQRNRWGKPHPTCGCNCAKQTQFGQVGRRPRRRRAKMCKTKPIWAGGVRVPAGPNAQNEANLAHQALWHRHPADDPWAGCPCHRFGEVANCAKRTQFASAQRNRWGKPHPTRGAIAPNKPNSAWPAGRLGPGGGETCKTKPIARSGAPRRCPPVGPIRWTWNAPRRPATPAGPRGSGLGLEFRGIGLHCALSVLRRKEHVWHQAGKSLDLEHLSHWSAPVSSWQALPGRLWIAPSTRIPPSRWRNG